MTQVASQPKPKIKKMKTRKYLNKNVYLAAQERISWTFNNFDRIYLSFSGGKDSTVMLHLVMEEAKKRNRKVGLLFIDWECQFNLTINHIKKMLHDYQDYLEVYWTQFEILTNNATSMYEPIWKSWDDDKKDIWTREKETSGTITNGNYFPFYFKNITFEEFIVLFAKWYSRNEPTACFVGIRAQESLNRFRAISKDNRFNYQNKKYTTNSVDDVWNVYPMYDWKVDDIWLYIHKYKKCYNELYDRMHLAGLKPSQMRVDEPFGDEARKNLWIYHIIEADTWGKIVARMNGVNSGALYSQDSGNILGNVKISLPSGHTWKSFSNHLLNTMPPKTAEHYKNKIAVYLKWYKDKGYPDDIPDQAEWKEEQTGKVPAWRQVAKALLKNDYWCRTLGFGINKSSAYEKYLALMQKRRKEWKIYE